MTPEAAVYQFMSGFGIPAYASTAVPDDAELPYITYDLVVGSWGDTEVNVPVNVWYRTSGEAVLNAKVREIGSRLGIGGITLPCDGGIVWFKKGEPWAQAVYVEGEDENVKRRYVNINIEYLVV